MKNIFVITLGCPKNQVDSEYLLGQLTTEKSFKIADKIEEAEVIIINTCGFIEDAREESIDTILEAVYYKEHGKCEKLIVTGCLTQRYREEILEEIPEVDAIMGTSKLDIVNETILQTLSGSRVNNVGDPGFNYTHHLPRKTENKHFNYVKIAEGCNNNCTYCSIPAIRGPVKSRYIEDIYTEVKGLTDTGVKEIILIAQDTTSYGLDLYGKPALITLLKELVKIKDINWLRLLYSYPEHISPELINIIKNEDKLCNYLDLPVQHSANKIRRLMKREGKREDIIEIIKMIRREIPDIALRTSLIVGFPGETENDFADLYDFVKEIRFERLGVFQYSKEEGTPAADFKDHLPKDVKEERFEQIMQLQQQISLDKNLVLIGSKKEIIVDEIIEDQALCRSRYDAPDIDNQIILPASELKPGDILTCRIKEAYEYDLVGERVYESTQ